MVVPFRPADKNLARLFVENQFGAQGISSPTIGFWASLLFSSVSARNKLCRLWGLANDLSFLAHFGGSYRFLACHMLQYDKKSTLLGTL